MAFQLFKNGNGKHIIQADKRLDNERFYYLINYLNFPEGIDYNIDIEGFTTGKDENALKNKNLLIYISPADKDFDNVFITTSENEKFKFDFSGKFTVIREGKHYFFPPGLTYENPDLLRVKKNSHLNKKERINKGRIEKRFKWISLVALSLILISLVVFIYNTHAFVKFTFLIGIGIGAWFFIDYEML